MLLNPVADGLAMFDSKITIWSFILLMVQKSCKRLDMVNIPLFTGFYTSQVVQDFLHLQSKQMLFFNFGSMAGTKQSMTCGCVSGTAIIRDFDVVPRPMSGLTFVILRCTKGPHKLLFSKKPPNFHFATTLCYPTLCLQKLSLALGQRNATIVLDIFVATALFN